ncbi:phosphoenolpyruvate synthase [Candidatus Dependentiae bacterium]|nr:phosphoenolpyruvate synthase [Candidatus Dependentiae bacterium]
MKYIKLFKDTGINDIAIVGGKNASIGEMIQHLSSLGIRIPQGFAITSESYWHHLKSNHLISRLKQIAQQLEFPIDVSVLQQVGQEIRKLIYDAPLPQDLEKEIVQAYEELCKIYKPNCDVAVRSSATAEDLPSASFAGQQETYLNVKGADYLLDSVKKCMASLFTDRAIVYRINNKIDHFQVGISVGIQKMVRSDLACAGVAFTLDTDTGFKDIVEITSSYGLGQALVSGLVNPDEFHVHKKTLMQGFRPIIKKQLGDKEIKIIYDENKSKTPIKTVDLDLKDRNKFSLTDDEILELSKYCCIIEDYYSKLNNKWMPMDIEWAKDGQDGKIYIVQARPETVHSLQNRAETLTRYYLQSPNNVKILLQGLSVGQKIANGAVKILKSLKDSKNFEEGDILVTSMTDPDWVPIMKKAAAIITDKGGRTCHAAIVSRELGIPAIIGTKDATKILHDGQNVTVDCSQGYIGYIYDGVYTFEKHEIVLKNLKKPPVQLMLNIADPNRAYELSFLPVDGVGLARMEFTINSIIKIHPMAIVHPERIKNDHIKNEIEQLSLGYQNPKDFFVDRLAQALGTIAGAFYPRPVIIRFSDFKSNEYANLIGGQLFEPKEENPMIGFRGAIRYCSENYADGFALECAALKKVYKEMGFTNIQLMIPFVRNLYDARCALDAVESNGINYSKDKIKMLMMCEIPSNVILIDEFSKLFDGFSIGSNDLTQLTLGVDRDSTLLASLFDERDLAVKKLIEMAIKGAKKAKKHIGICGQAPSDFPDFAHFLIENKIDSISLNSDSVLPFLLSLSKK